MQCCLTKMAIQGKAFSPLFQKLSIYFPPKASSCSPQLLAQTEGSLLQTLSAVPYRVATIPNRWRNVYTLYCSDYTAWGLYVSNIPLWLGTSQYGKIQWQHWNPQFMLCIAASTVWYTWLNTPETEKMTLKYHNIFSKLLNSLLLLMLFDLSFCGLISCRYQVTVIQAKTLTFSPFCI